MKFSCCTTIDNYDLVAANGYDRIILPAMGLLAMDAQAFAATQRKLKAGPLECVALNSFCTPQLVFCGHNYDEQTVADYIRPLAARASELGIRQMGVGAPQSRNIPPEFPKQTALAQFGRTLSIICDACRPYGIDILLEAICGQECNFITTTAEACEIIEMLQISNLKLVYDIYHAFMMNEDDQPLRRAMKYVQLVHIAQEINGQRHYLRAENLEEYQVFTRALLEEGYDGEVSVEAFIDNMEVHLASTLAIMRSLLL